MPSRNRDIIRENCRKFRANHPGYDSIWAKNNGYKAQKAWKSKNKNRVNSYTRKRQAIIKTTSVELVDYNEVIKQSNGICQICHKQLDESVEIDHTIPLAKGGSHTYDNVQAVHGNCNRRKWTRMPNEIPVFEIGRR